MNIRVLSVGPHWQGGTSLERVHALELLGAEVVPFDMTPFHSRGNRLVQSLHSRLLSGPNIAALNHAIVAAAREQGPFDLIWFEKATWVWPETIERVRSHGRFLVHFTPDPGFLFHGSRHFLKSVPIYDLCITNKRYELEHYRNFGSKKTILVPQGAGSRFEHSIGNMPTVDPVSDIVFVGHCERHYMRSLKPLVAGGLSVRIVGPGWRKKCGRDRELGPAVKGDGAFDTAYVDELQKAHIGLGLLSKLAPDQFTTRSFEIPAAGRLLLAERTPDHQLLFEEGVEAEFYGDPEEMVAKARMFLADPDRARTIAAAGQRRVRENYQWHHVLAPAFDALGLPVPAGARAARPNPLEAIAA